MQAAHAIRVEYNMEIRKKRKNVDSAASAMINTNGRVHVKMQIRWRYFVLERSVVGLLTCRHICRARVHTPSGMLVDGSRWSLSAFSKAWMQRLL